MSKGTSLDWIRKDPSCTSVCDKIRSSLLAATRRCDEDADEESRGAATGRKIPLQCGHAKYQDKKRVWNIRHRAIIDASASGTTTRRIDSLESLATLTRRNSHSHVTDLVQHPAQLICRLKEKFKKSHPKKVDTDGEPAANNNLAVPPSGLIQSILRGTELASMFQQARKDMVCWSFVGRQPINLDPVLNVILQKNNSFDSKDPNTRDALLDRASQYSMKLTADYVEKWGDYTAFWDGDTLVDFEEEDNEAFDAIYSFVENCLDEGLQGDPAAATPLVKRKRSLSEPTGSGVESRKRRRRTSSEGDDHAEYSSSILEGKDPILKTDPPSRLLPRGTRVGKKSVKRTPARAAKSIKENLKPLRKNPSRSSRPLVLLEPGQLSAREIEKGITVEDLGNFTMQMTKSQPPAEGKDNSTEMSHDDERVADWPQKTGDERGAPSTRTPECKTNSIPEAENTTTPASIEQQSVRRRKRSESIDSAQSRLRRSPRKRFRWDDTEQMQSPFGCHTKSDQPHGLAAHLSQDARSKLPLVESGLASKPLPSIDSVLSISNIEADAAVVDDKILSSAGNVLHPKNEHPSLQIKPKEIDSHEHEQHGKDPSKPLDEGRNDLGIKLATARPASFEMDPDVSKKIAPAKELSHVATQDQESEKGTTNSSIETEQLSHAATASFATGHSHQNDGEGAALWVKLSHIGHISDYHGFQRRHDTFFPLKFNKSVSETREAIEATLVQAEAEKVEANDQDIDDELRTLDTIYANSYPQKAKEEHQRKVVGGNQSDRTGHQSCLQKDHAPQPLPEARETFESRPILFSRTAKESLQDCALGDDCDICRIILKGEGEDNVDQAKPCAKFQFIETEDSLEFWKEDESGNTRKRPSRTSELNAYRRISVMMLREMRNTLNFIEEYNKGLDGKASSAVDVVQTGVYEITRHNLESAEKRVQESAEAQGKKVQIPQERRSSADTTRVDDGDDVRAHATGQTRADFVISGHDAVEQIPGHRDAKPHHSRQTRESAPKPGQGVVDHIDHQHSIRPHFMGRTRAQSGSHQIKSTDGVHYQPQWVRLSHVGLLSDYQGLSRQHKSFYPLPTHGSTEALKNTIAQIIDDNGVDANDDDEILAEHRAYVRIVRGYNGKADQERIEKNEHEEQRLLKVREFEYWNKGKKLSPEEEELSRLETRQIRFVQRGGATSSGRKECRFGVNCLLCKPPGTVNLKLPTDDKGSPSILNPGFQKKGIDDVEDPEEVGNPKARRSRTAELRKQRRISVLHLKEMYNTLDFIEKYNAGWIKTTGNRRKKT
jgi:hypothetical protein